MKLFLAYLIICFFSGVILIKKPALRGRVLLLLCILLCVGYYFLNKI